ncbi:eCIS core domain-containing protein [Frankia sp. Cas3]|uniref:eCIS core domain-containing protein n=1 Tax=Frankia sp. Cas3 TaxID=3073926 RepID=UPI002AD280C7|nr:DUF4157 domain-containing protein [Frankia sp. Cas3]
MAVDGRQGVRRQEMTRTPGAGVLRRACACDRRAAAGTCDTCGEKNAGTLRRSAAGPTPANEAPPIVHEVLRSSGRALDAPTRAVMEPRFGADFSRVRVHTDTQAAQSARAVHALAYTVGPHIAFDEGRYSPATDTGRRLLAHELTHVVQQAANPAPLGTSLRVGDSTDPAEHTAARVASGQPDLPVRIGSVTTPVVQRDGPPIDSERSATVTPRVSLENIGLTLDVLRGRHELLASIDLRNPIKVLGLNLPGIPESELAVQLQYSNACNEAVQGLVASLGQQQRPGGPVVDFGKNRWQVGLSGSFRGGTVIVQPGLSLGFEGSTFDTVTFTLGIALGASTKIPYVCLPSAPQRPRTDRPNGPDRPVVPDGPGRPVAPPPLVPAPLPGLTLHFFYDSTLRRPESTETFRQLKDILDLLPDVHVVLTGHTSLEGREKYNMGLSVRRAEAVRAELVTAGIDAARLHTLAAGETAPAYPEPAVEQHGLSPSLERLRTLNRRVEVSFFDPTGRFPDSPLQLTSDLSGSFRAAFGLIPIQPAPGHEKGQQ